MCERLSSLRGGISFYTFVDVVEYVKLVDWSNVCTFVDVVECVYVCGRGRMYYACGLVECVHTCGLVECVYVC